ncbi:MAG: uracil-DNA glycosylase [Ilumatobacteraceae bacterium]
MTSMFGDWEPFLSQEMAQPYFLELQNSVNDDRQHHTVYPAEQDVLTAFTSTSYERTSVLILGQDPYHGDGQAHGLSFSVPENIALPPSLRNIMKERNSDVDIPFPRHGNLTKWATQGVLLLNSTLTVRAGEAGSHQDFGWETFSNAVITHLNQKSTRVVFVLWGKSAKAKQQLITAPHHVVLTAPHPSPLSAHRGFFGSRPFSRINSALSDSGQQEINWENE